MATTKTTKTTVSKKTESKTTKTKKAEPSQDWYAEKMHQEFLKQPLKIYTEKGAQPTKKKKVARRAKKAPVKLENGEYIATPTTLAKLKTYVNKYYKAVGWKAKDYVFPNTNIHIREFKTTDDKEKQIVNVTFKVMFITKRTYCVKKYSVDYTLEKHNVRGDIINVYRQINNQKYFVGDKVNDREKLNAQGWVFVYDNPNE